VDSGKVNPDIAAHTFPVAAKVEIKVWAVVPIDPQQGSKERFHVWSKRVFRYAIAWKTDLDTTSEERDERRQSATHTQSHVKFS
jgi:hypothetical protein